MSWTSEYCEYDLSESEHSFILVYRCASQCGSFGLQSALGHRSLWFLAACLLYWAIPSKREWARRQMDSWLMSVGHFAGQRYLRSSKTLSKRPRK